MDQHRARRTSKTEMKCKVCTSSSQPSSLRARRTSKTELKCESAWSSRNPLVVSCSSDVRCPKLWADLTDQSKEVIFSTKKKHTGDLQTRQSRHGGGNAKSGCCPTKATVRHWSRTFRAFYKHSGARKKMLAEVEAHIEYCAKR